MLFTLLNHICNYLIGCHLTSEIEKRKMEGLRLTSVLCTTPPQHAHAPRMPVRTHISPPRQAKSLVLTHSLFLFFFIIFFEA